MDQSKYNIKNFAFKIIYLLKFLIRIKLVSVLGKLRINTFDTNENREGDQLRRICIIHQWKYVTLFKYGKDIPLLIHKFVSSDRKALTYFRNKPIKRKFIIHQIIY